MPIQGLERLLILLCVSVPSFMINLDSNIVAVSLPSIAQSLHANFADIEWVVSAYTLTFASCVLPAGALADRYGRKRMLLVGLFVFSLASFFCGAASSVLMLNVARTAQGLGAAILLSAALATLSHTFRGEQRAQAFAFWGSVIGIAISLGPVAGGFITQHFGWEWAFYVNLPIGGVMIALTWRYVLDSRDPRADRIDFPGAITFAGSLFLMTLALINGNHDSWESLSVLSELAASIVLFAVFVWVESRQHHPMLDLNFFRKPTYVGANIAAVAYAAGLLTMLTYLPVYFQSGLGYSPQVAGLLMLPIAVPLFIVPRIVAAYFTHRFSGRALLTAGLATVGVGLLWLAMHTTSFQYSAMFAGLLIAGIGAGILNGETAKVGMSVIPPERAGMASGVSGTIRFSGIVLGFAALGAVLFQRVFLALSEQMPATQPQDIQALTRDIVAGHITPISNLTDSVGTASIALHSFGLGYQAVLFGGSLIVLFAAICTWFLVRSADTAPTVAQTAQSNQMNPTPGESQQTSRAPD